jgi:leucyl-tRNA synthetase
MPNWAGSSWYYLRYIDPENDLAIADKSKLEYWMPVDWYNGGMEHTTLHLLYSRFWNKFLYDCGIVPVSEPYLKRTSHGMILGESGEKMSKSRDNVINPDEVVENYGADVFRLYEMFIGPFDQAVAWNTKGIVGINRFIGKVWRFYTQSKIEDVELTGDQLRILHSTIKKVSEDIETLDLNTAVSQLMICINEFTSFDVFPKSAAVVILKLLSPFAPHICEELWNYLGNDDTIAFESWPIHNEKYLNKDAMSIAIQVNGKLRSTIEIPANISEEEAIYAAKNDEKIARYLNGREVRKEIYIRGRLINIVIE